MGRRQQEASVAALQEAAHPLAGRPGDYDPLLERMADARVVLLGEATHGTHEFYRERARITRRLIEEHGFTAVAVEADWPDAYRVNRYVRSIGGIGSTDDALGDFARFPTWMWRNVDVLSFAGWLHAHNRSLPSGAPRVGFYGLDLYSLFTSMRAVLDYLDRVDPEAARRARERYACFDAAAGDPERYAWLATGDRERSCEEEVVAQLVELRRRAAEVAGGEDGAGDELFAAEQNARLVRNAEAYYRTMVRGGTPSWNLRDRHMMGTLEAIVSHLDLREERSRVVVWAHNSHVGDARAAELGGRGQLSLGQLARERFGEECFLVGFTTYEGTVSAASDWDAPVERKGVLPARPDSHEGLLHRVGWPAFLLPLDRGGAADVMRSSRLERAIGVIYRPESERASHYFTSRLADRFDALIHFDVSHAVQPLDATPAWTEAEDLPETYPFAV